MKELTNSQLIQFIESLEATCTDKNTVDKIVKFLKENNIWN
jgi:hypothetical protein